MIFSNIHLIQSNRSPAIFIDLINLQTEVLKGRIEIEVVRGQISRGWERGSGASALLKVRELEPN